MVVVEERGTPAGLRQAPRERRRERGRAAPGRGETHVLAAPKPSSIYRGEGGGVPPLGFRPQGVRQPQIPSRVAAQGGRGGNLPPKQGGAPPPQTLGALGPCGGGGAHQPTWGWSPPTLGPCSPPGPVAPLGGPPGPSRWSRYVTDKTRNFFVTKTGLPIYKSLPPDHSGTPRDIRDLIWDSEQHSVTTYIYSL